MSATVRRLQDLILPMTEEEFRARLARREPYFLYGTDSQRYDGLLDWQRLADLIRSGVYPSHAVQLMRESVAVPAALYEKAGTVDPAKMLPLLERGMSAVFAPLDSYVHSLGQLSDSIKKDTLDRVWTGAIVTTGDRSAFDNHFDTQDLLILQIEGSKRWYVYGSPVLQPIRGMERPPRPAEPAMLDIVLHPGDLLFVPAGYWHHCKNGPDRSLHVVIFFEPLTPPHVLLLLTRRLLKTQEKRLPLGRAGNLQLDGDTVKAELIRELAEVSWQEIVDEHQNGEVPYFHLLPKQVY